MTNKIQFTCSNIRECIDFKYSHGNYPIHQQLYIGYWLVKTRDMIIVKKDKK